MASIARALTGIVLCTTFAASAQETVPQPAQSAAEAAQKAAAEQSSATAPSEATRSFDRPANQTIVREPRLLGEEERIGDYDQPRWTARRRFATTRVYVVPKGEFQLEYWLDSKIPLAYAVDTRFRSQFELEVGLGHRLQLDLYLTTQQKGIDAPMEVHREKIELRYALADWGVIPANPTLYFEVVRQNDAPPLGEVKLLLGGEAAPRWHWGANLVFERELGGATEGHEYAVSGGISYTVRDMVLSVGAELQVQATDVRGSRFHFEEVEPLLGPSIQWRPVPQMHIDLVALFGVAVFPNARGETMGAVGPPPPRAIAEPLLVVGWEL